ncbi:hypothetical protein TRIUR3_26180 [Triticum urartu]|uniref:Uncharacterized protein n=1 Tax=Triticum urartu TaxID=4572 RepID=M8AJL6_TRIUA|nr:hypothetical protein TRIUR3_26180 [Triticum urartu]
MARAALAEGTEAQRAAEAKPCGDHFTITVTTPSCCWNSSTTSPSCWIKKADDVTELNTSEDDGESGGDDHARRSEATGSAAAGAALCGCALPGRLLRRRWRWRRRWEGRRWWWRRRQRCQWS